MTKGAISVSRLALMAALGASATLAATTAARAEMTLYDQDGVTINGAFGAGVGVFSVGNAQFGAGIPNASGTVVRDFQWIETFVKPGLSGSIATSAAGSFYGGVSGLMTTTNGDGDAAGTTFGEPHSVEVEDAYLGWKSASLVPMLGEDGIDFSFGRQSFALGDGFLLADGNADGGRHGAYWFGARTAWANSAILRLGADTPVRGDVFWLRSDTDTAADHIYGANVEYTHDGIGTFGAAYFKVDDSLIRARRDLDVYNLRANTTPIPMAPDFGLAGEIAFEEGGSARRDVSANAWYLEPSYTLSTLPWTPRVAYRYASFSGDDPTTTEDEGFDPLHYGMLGGWGTWFQGEIVGEYMWGNSNLNSHRLHVSVAPAEDLTVGGMLYRFTFNEPAAIGVTDDHLADELNFYADWAVTENLSVSGVVGYAWAGEGGKQLTGGTEDSQSVQVIALINF